MKELTFANPNLLYLLILVIPIIIWYILKNRDLNASIQISTLKGIGKSFVSYKYFLRHFFLHFGYWRLHYF
ncbi:MAG: BatA domain-containing protein [Marinilabiliales bacterium]|nr:BatA domain-containing protein [Marinilabiliales bacterium]